MAFAPADLPTAIEARLPHRAEAAPDHFIDRVHPPLFDGAIPAPREATVVAGTLAQLMGRARGEPDRSGGGGDHTGASERGDEGALTLGGPTGS